eukprot:359853-Chlamydomonas_euryale.AAC.1
MRHQTYGFCSAWGSVRHFTLSPGGFVRHFTLSPGACTAGQRQHLWQHSACSTCQCAWLYAWLCAWLRAWLCAWPCAWLAPLLGCHRAAAQQHPRQPDAGRTPGHKQTQSSQATFSRPDLRLPAPRPS